MHSATVTANDWPTLGSSTSDAGRSPAPACLITPGDKDVSPWALKPHNAKGIQVKGRDGSGEVDSGSGRSIMVWRC